VQGIEVVRAQAGELAQKYGLSVEAKEEGGQIFIVIVNAPLPEGKYDRTTVDVLFITDNQYPLSALDTFWTDIGLRRRNGQEPQAVSATGTHLGRQWRQLSWHRNGIWNPAAANGIIDHYEIVLDRWRAEAES